MGNRRIILAAAFVALLCAPRLCVAATGDSGPVAYIFKNSSSYVEVGCQGPCACPLVFHPIGGSFQLAHTHSDPMFDYYDVLEFRAVLDAGSGPIQVTGSGTYRIGGEFALTQQMTLDLAIGQKPPERFDSGVVPIQAAFPNIDVACAVHGFACYDTVLVLRAGPGTAGVPEPRAGVSGLRRIQPNPFRASAEITFRMSRDGPLERSVMDIAGRRVRTLLSEPWMAAGERPVTWDGRRDDGRRVPAGLYWIRMDSPDGSDRRRLVRLE